jgi:hypothetical protein
MTQVERKREGLDRVTQLARGGQLRKNDNSTREMKTTPKK